MRFTPLRLALLAGLALPLGLATASLAEDAAPAAGAPGLHHDHHWGDHHWGDPAQRRAHMAEHLSAVLQLQPGQQAALAAYLDSIKPPGDMHEGMSRHDDAAKSATTPERLDRMLAHLDAMRAHLVARADATKRFYAQLSPSQQKAFDDIAPMMMHRMGDHGDHMHHGDHEMGPGGQPTG